MVSPLCLSPLHNYLSFIASFVSIRPAALQLSFEVSGKNRANMVSSRYPTPASLRTSSRHHAMPQSRKRNAPGSMAINPASPQPIQYPYQPTAPMGTQAVDWSYTSNDNGVAAALSGLAGYNFSPYPQQQLVPSETSTQLARRPTGNRTAADLGGGSIENWPARPVQSFQAPQRHEAWVEDLGELKERAAAIKRESQSGRKAIPPFIRKLRR